MASGALKDKGGYGQKQRGGVRPDGRDAGAPVGGFCDMIRVRLLCFYLVFASLAARAGDAAQALAAAAGAEDEEQQQVQPGGEKAEGKPP